MTTAMTTNKPYLIRALYDWIVDNELTPYLLVNTQFPEVQVPEAFINPDGRIVLNVSPTSCRGLHLENDRILFTASFSGQATQIFLSPRSVLAIYAQENGKGMEFPEEENDDGPLPPPNSGAPIKKNRPSLKVVK